MKKQFNVTKATPAGDQWESHGQMLQTFFLNLEGVTDHWATINRKAGSPMLSGLHWFEVEETTSKKGTPGYKLKVAQAPDATEQQTAIIKSEPNIRWGLALIVAGLQVKLGTADKVIEYAREIYASSPIASTNEAHTEKPADTKDTVIEDLPQGEIDFEDIPF